MNSSEKEKAIFRNLFVKSIDGQITQEEVQQFNVLLSSNPDLEDYYIQCVRLQVVLREIRIFNDFCVGNEPDYKNQALWREFAEYEKIAPNIEIPAAPKESESDEEPDEVKKAPPQVNKFSLYSLLLSSAALIFLIVYAYFSPANRGIEVATLSDTLNAKWADGDHVLQDGVRLVTKSDPLRLQEGIAKLVFDNGSVVVLEGPSNFEILTEDQIQLDYGRLYVTVPRQAIGFTISTSNAKLIDLGTEFGVKTDPDGMEVHVLRGKTLLISGSGKDPKNQYELRQGQAKAVLKTGAVRDISLKKEAFVRGINSKAGLIWKGQARFDLADIAGGGDGFGTGKIDTGINPISGKPATVLLKTQAATNAYHLVPSNPFIDGVFIPNGRTKQIISSQGYVFHECPVTSGSCFNNILNAVRAIGSETTQDTAGSDLPRAAHCLLVHANVGVTYDLQAIRDLLPDADIVRFQSKCGIEKGALRPNLSNADFWVLVDGQLRYQKTQVKAKTLFPVEVELSKKDRFLTLVATEGNDPKSREIDNVVYPAIDSDWCMFADPVLVLE